MTSTHVSCATQLKDADDVVVLPSNRMDMAILVRKVYIFVRHA